MTTKTTKGPARHGRRADPLRAERPASKQNAREINTRKYLGDQRLSPRDLARQAREAFATAIAVSDPLDLADLVASLSGIIATAEAADVEMNVKSAAHIACRSEGTIRAWIARHRIGIRRGGRYVVFRGRLEALLADVAREEFHA